MEMWWVSTFKHLFSLYFLLQLQSHTTINLLFLKVEKYQGLRSESDLKSYVKKKLGLKEDKTDEDSSGSSGMLTLNSETFQSGISEGLSFVKFFAPWCGHCKRLAPIWNELYKKTMGKPNVKLLKVDCTLDNSKELCNEQEVSVWTCGIYSYQLDKQKKN